MKKYYINYYKNFTNTYNLFYAETAEDDAAIPEGAERITRAEAIRMASAEAAQRKNDPSFSGHADAYIFPAAFDRDENVSEIVCGWSRNYYLDGRIVCRR